MPGGCSRGVWCVRAWMVKEEERRRKGVLLIRGGLLKEKGLKTNTNPTTPALLLVLDILKLRDFELHDV